MRVRRTFAFMDLSGFTHLTDVEGDEKAVKLLGVFRTLVREMCSRRGVRIAKWLGDGAMLVGVETTPVLATALELQRSVGTAIAPLALKCGITTGPVILLEGDDYIGHAVNMAARLCDLAGDNQVLASPEVLAALPDWATSRQHGDHQVRGVDRPMTVVQLALRANGETPGLCDPICGIPLPGTAKALSHGPDGPYFCSDSCLETWQGRPT